MNIDELLAKNQGIQLDIGCGANKQPDFVGIDVRPLDGVDIVQDLQIQPWPLPGASVIRAVSHHLVEHINPANFGFINFMDEVWRIMKPQGQFAISCPHGSSQGYIQDPTHINPINETTWAYFDPEEPRGGGILYNIYHPKPWKIAFLEWSPTANIEVLLVKRELDEQ